MGWAICSYAFPNLEHITHNAYNKQEISVSPYIILFPAWFLVGTLAVTWLTYLMAALFAESNLALFLHQSSWLRTPLVPANIISMSVAIILIFIVVLKKFFLDGKFSTQKIGSGLVCSDEKTRKLEFYLIIFVTLLAFILMWVTFHVKGNQLFIGATVYSDFSPHLGMIRSFSYGNNFPTQYAHFAGEDIRYHFMFQFLVGNLEFLGLRLDYAFNLPSILSFVSAFLLLYLLAVKITGRKAIGILSCLFFAFRSSKSLFTYLANLPEHTNFLQELMKNTKFIGDTTHEDWGLWNLNVYCNQRHLAFGLAAIFFIIILFLPYFYEMIEAIGQVGTSLDGNNKEKKEMDWIKKLKILFLAKDAWLIQDVKFPIVSGLMLGSLGFFHGSAVIACIMMLGLLALFSKRRLGFLITAVISITLVILQTHFFIKGSTITPDFLFGFIAEKKTFFGVLSYLGRLLGILPIVLLTAFCFEKITGRWIMFVFSIPLIFSFFISLTIDVTVNHKYIMISCILLGIYAADLIFKMFKQKDIMFHIAGVLLIIMLTATGFYDFLTVIKANTVNSYITLDFDDPTTEWVHEHSSSKDIFLTSNYTINKVVFGGAMLYQGWQYFAWSAGYDTQYRDSMVKLMYEADTPETLNSLVKQNKIRFIIVDIDNRNNTAYKVNETNISSTYQCVYYVGTGNDKLSIYDTKKRLKQ